MGANATIKTAPFGASGFWIAGSGCEGSICKRMGYELEKNCDPHYWDHVELFMTYRACFSYMTLCRMGENAPEVVVRWRKFYAHVLQQEDILSALSEASRLYLQNK